MHILMEKFAALSILLVCNILVAHFTTTHVSAASDTCDFPAIFNFGDANSDTGNAASVFFGRSANFGQSYFRGNEAGRASDGRLMIDFFASSLGLPFLHGFLDSLGADFSHGANFANVLATITLPRSVLPVVRPPRGSNPVFFDLQIAQFAQFANRSQAQEGLFKSLMPKKDYFSKALYTLDIGQVDISQELLDNKTNDEIKALIPTWIDRFSSNVKILYSLGGRTFWIHNTGPIGCLPYLLTMAPVSDDKLDSAGCAKSYNEVAQYFNNLLKKGVDQLRKDLPLVAFTYVDVYTPKYALYQQPELYGFTHPHESCCGYGGRYNFGENSLCGSTIIVNGTQFIVGPCKTPTEYINYEGVTYTQAADEIVSKRIASGKFSDPPNSLKNACQK